MNVSEEVDLIQNINNPSTVRSDTISSTDDAPQHTNTTTARSDMPCNMAAPIPVANITVQDMMATMNTMQQNTNCINTVR